MKKYRFLAVLACSMSIVAHAGLADCEAAHHKTVVNIDKHHNDTSKVSVKGGSLAERIQAILHPVQEEAEAELPVPVKPQASINDNMILGAPVADQAQCVRYLLHNNPHPLLNVSPEELVAYYYEEGRLEGVRPDIAFAQALKETGYFSVGGTVVPAQNNYCGLGTTSRSVRGAYFDSPRLGVRAHIQHLLAYSSTALPKADIVDPRYDLVRSTYGTSTLNQWQDLNGRWAVPGVGYGQSILDYYRGILNS